MEAKAQQFVKKLLGKQQHEENIVLCGHIQQTYIIKFIGRTRIFLLQVFGPKISKVSKFVLIFKCWLFFSIF